MDRIPAEILCRVFLLALPYPIHPYMYTMYRNSVLVPLRISHVCRVWRDLSLSFGALWSYLCINCFAYTTGSTVKVFDTWLERTKGMPLNFYIRCDGYWERRPELHRDAEHIITTMISQQHRWKEVKLVWMNVQLSPDFPGLKLTNMPKLESLILTARLPLCANISIAQSPRLKRFVIQELDFDLETGEHPMHSLSESGDIFFDYVNRPGSDALNTWLNFLKATPNLKEFRACSSRFTSPPPFRPTGHTEPYITLPNLQVLKLEMNGSDAAASYTLDYLTLPGLQHLIFASNDAEIEAKGLMLINFFRRSLPPLTSLVVLWHFVNEDIIIQALHLLPTLKYLRVSGANASRRLFDELAVATTNNGFSYAESRNSDLDVDMHIGAAVCPSLETLFFERLKLGFDTRGSCSAFITMLRSRAKVSRKFRSIHLRDSSGRPVGEPPAVKSVGLSAIDEDIGSFRQKLRVHLVEQGVVIGDYDAVNSLLIRGGL